MLKDTIISAFNYDGTLLKWLKKVEKALQDDTLTNIEVVTNSDYSMQLKLTFGDNTFIMSPVFTNKGRGIVSISKTATSGLVDTYTVTYTDNTTSTFTVTNAEGFNANNLYNTLTAGTGIELTNDGQAVTVTAKRLLNEIVDSEGHNRFTSYPLKLLTIDGKIYSKAVLSGSHLCIVVAFVPTSNVRLTAGNIIASFNYDETHLGMPAWLRSKIIPFSSANTGVVAISQMTHLYYDNYGVAHSDNVGYFCLTKGENTWNDAVRQSQVANIDLVAGEYYRVQFDLAID